MEYETGSTTSGLLADHPEFAKHMLPVISKKFPFLIEKNTGYVYPYTHRMAERSDLVEGCYDLLGSKDPNDRPKNYDPAVEKNIQRRQDAKRTVLPANQAEFQAKLLELKQQVEATVRAEYEQKFSEMSQQEKTPGSDTEKNVLPGMTPYITQERVKDKTGDPVSDAMKNLMGT